MSNTATFGQFSNSRGAGHALKAGIVGTGFIGTVHARAVVASGGRVWAIAAKTLEEARAAQAVTGAVRAVTFEELLIDPEIDVIHICTPNVFHSELAESAIRHGKHVICEKPLAISPAEAERLVALAREFEVVASIPYVYRYYPSIREARSRIRNLKEPLNLLHGYYLQDWLSRETTFNWRVDPKYGGPSRTFGDIGIHWCDLMEFVTGHRITRLQAQLMKVFSSRGDIDEVDTEDGVTMIFHTDKGAQGSLVLSQISAGRKNKLWFSFESPTESFAFDQESPNQLWIGGLESNQIILRGVAEESDDARLYSFLPAGHPQGFQDCFNAFIADTYNVIKGLSVNDLPSFNDGLRSVKLTDAVLRSAKSNAWVEVL